jgi:hypothetical protein
MRSIVITRKVLPNTELPSGLGCTPLALQTHTDDESKIPAIGS